MAEALLNSSDSEHFEAISAGIDCGQMHPLTVEVMNEIGMDLRGKATKATHDILHLRFDIVITLCDRAKSECPRFPDAELVHWRFDDPVAVLDPTKQKHLFQSLRDQIAQRVRLFALVQARFVSIDAHVASASAFSA
jgi:protein-tyrosine-phosphatase